MTRNALLKSQKRTDIRTTLRKYKELGWNRRETGDPEHRALAVVI
jgi:hypothetical protein